MMGKVKKMMGKKKKITSVIQDFASYSKATFIRVARNYSLSSYVFIRIGTGT